MRADTYQVLLIASGLLVAALFSVFFYREIFPEYKIYQNDYLALEEFRSTYTHQASPPFQSGIKQIVIEREDRGPASVDRCTSCHVALQIPYFSPTKIAMDVNGNMILDGNGHPLQIPNEEYIWQKLDDKIAALRDPEVIAHLQKDGRQQEAKERTDLALKYESLKIAKVGNQIYDVKKVLTMHPLMGNEVRPFEYHPIEEYSCTSCHNGNGRGLTTDKAHGPVFDGQYEIEEHPTLQFTESDPKNDPRFAHIFNHKPGHSLLFQTEPLYIGPLMQAKCMNCHQTSQAKFEENFTSTLNIYQKRQNSLALLVHKYEEEKQAVLDLLHLQNLIQQKGVAQTVTLLKDREANYLLPESERKRINSQITYLETTEKGQITEQQEKLANEKILRELRHFIGSDELISLLFEEFQQKESIDLEIFLQEHKQDAVANGVLFQLAERIALNEDELRHAKEMEKSFSFDVQNQKTLSSISTDIDELTLNYQRGKELYFSQACYACHRIAGLARGGVGPELTRIGNSYPWYIKESIVWPQADLASSTMPNMRMDHLELQDLMTFLLAQKGNRRSIAQTTYQADLLEWEAGKKMPWEKPIPSSEMYDLRNSMTIFATEGCASCHRLQGFESNVGFQVEKEADSNEKIHDEQSWFRKLFPEVVHYTTYDEELPGSEIVATIEKNATEIDRRIVSGVRQNGLLDEIDQKHPKVVESLYSPFQFASRAKDDYFRSLIKNEKDAEKVAQLQTEWQNWKDRVYRVLMVYVQTYGLGRLIGPHLNWSGVYRTDEWLMEHFHNPGAYVPRSIMPVFPFDDTKFYALTHMLDVLGIRNRRALRQLWDQKGFSPEESYNMLCAQCHGIGLVGNGVIAEWIYPIPKNLHDPNFLRNLTREKAIYSITHGVKGTPMPPWGESSTKPANVGSSPHGSSVLSESEIQYFVEWLFSSLSGAEVIRRQEDVPKWQYSPADIIHELEREGGRLIPLPPDKKHESVKPVEKDLPLENNPPPTIERVSNLLLDLKKPSLAGLYPTIYPIGQSVTKEKTPTVEDIFDAISNQTDTGKTSYYIKKEFYTPHNIEEGQRFFLLNCAVCHGNEADGTGARAQAMKSAKPRMLTNLDWIRSRDDLRLLRSIKYGVAGTSMTPWGDLTNALQRLQLVIFIRSLSEEQESREDLGQALYQTFDAAQLTVEEARINGNEQIRHLQQEIRQLRMRQNELEFASKDGKKMPQDAAKVYEQILELEKKIIEFEEKDQLLVALKTSLKNERELYSIVAINLLSKDLNHSIFQTYLKLIRFNAQRYVFDGNKLTIQHTAKIDQQIRDAGQEIADELDKKIAELNQQRSILGGKITSATKKEELSINLLEIESYKKIKAKLLSDIEEAIRLAHAQVRIVESMTY